MLFKKQHSILSALALWMLTVGPAAAQVSLGTAGNFGVLGGSTVTNTGPTVVNGDLGVSPGSAVTGFPPGIVMNGTIHTADAVAAQAQSDLVTAYNTLAGLACNTDLTGQDLGGLTLTPGVYCFSTSAQLTGTLTLNAQGNPNAQFVFQIGSTLTSASTASVQFINGGGSCNLYWQVGTSATFGTGSSIQGNVIALSSITLNTGANVSGRILARNGAVTLDSNMITPCTAGMCPSITVNPLTLPNPVLGTPYSQNITATGGNAPYTFTLSSGALPSNLLLNPNTGQISGTPNVSGSFNFSVTATDVNACPGTRPYSFQIAGVCPAVTVNPATLPNPVLGLPYNQTITATGGTAPYTFALSSGALPSNLLLNPSTGQISGTPNVSGTFNFTVTATDANNCPGSRAYTFIIAGVCPAVTVNPATLPNPVLGLPYNQSITATGGTAPYTFALSSGALPSNLLLNPSTGQISGTPNVSGTFNFTITATDINNCPGSRAYTFIIAGVCPAITVNPATLPNPVLGLPYNQSITATGGTAPYTFALSSGALPSNLLLNPSTGQISGTPNVSGTFNFTITATDINNCPGSRAYTFIIAGVCPAITVNPATLPNVVAGVPYQQTISASGGTGPYTFALSNGTLPGSLQLNPNTGVISGTAFAPGSFNFSVTATDANGCPGTRAYVLVIGLTTTVALPLSNWSALLIVLLLAGSGLLMRRRMGFS